MNNFQKRAIDLLDEIMKAPEGKRTTRLLPCPQSDEEPIKQGLSECSWSEGWAFNVPSTMASRLDIQYSKRKEKSLTIRIWTQGSNFDLSNCTFHGQNEHKNKALQVLEWHNGGQDTPSNCIVSFYNIENGAYSFQRQEAMTVLDLIKMLICGY